MWRSAALTTDMLHLKCYNSEEKLAYTPSRMYIYCLMAPLAQLDRASGYGPEGWGFESLRAYNG